MAISDAVSALSGMTLRLRADQITGGLSSGATVTTWPDASPGAYDATAVGATASTYQPTGVGGKPSVKFVPAGGGAFSSSAPSGGQAHTVVFIGKAPGPFNINSTVVASTADGGFQMRIDNGKGQLVAQFQQNLPTSTVTIADQTPVIIIATYDGTSGAYSFLVNGAAAGSGTGLTRTFVAGTTYIGGNYLHDSEYLKGDIAEVLTFSRVLTSAEQATIDSYAQDRYGITVADYTTGGGADTTAPTTPTGLAATPGTARVTLSWTASTDAVGVTGYRVRRGGTLVGSPTTTSYTDTGLTNGTTYSYTVSAVDAAGNESAQTSAVTATPVARTAGPTVPRVIFDTDYDSDVDDLGALAVLHALTDLGECTIIGMGVNSTNGGNALSLNAVNTYYGRASIPLALHQGSSAGISAYNQAIVNEYPHALTTITGLPNAATLYRQLLAAAPDGSVVIICTGFLDNISDLLSSPADGISSMTGTQLVAAKVHRLVVMGGQFPSGSEWNFTHAIPAAQYVTANWPTQMWFAGYELGLGILTGARLATDAPAGSPVRRGYQVYNNLANRESWDQAAVYAAIRINDGTFGVTDVGKITVASDGSNTWASTPDPSGAQEQLYLTQTNAATAKTRIEDLMVAAPASSADAAAPVVSSFAVATDRVSLTWAGSDNVGITRWVLKRGATVLYDGTATTYTETGLTSGTSYTYTLTAYDAAGNASTAATATASPGGTGSTFTPKRFINRSGTAVAIG